MRTENKRKTMVQKKENGVLSVPSELLLTAGIPLDCDLMIETVPGVILIVLRIRYRRFANLI